MLVTNNTSYKYKIDSELKLSVPYPLEFGKYYKIRISNGFFLKFSPLPLSWDSLFILMTFILPSGRRLVKECYLDSRIKERYVYFEECQKREALDLVLSFSMDADVPFALDFKVVKA